eukprot:403339951
MVQFRVDTSDCMFVKLNCSTIPQLTQECVKAMYSKQCNKNYIDNGRGEQGTTKAYYYPVPFTNRSKCALKNCEEYQSKPTNISLYQGFSTDYKNDAFLNKWLDEYTRAVIVQWNIYCTWVDSYFIFIFSVEDNGDGILMGSYKFYSINATVESEKRITNIYIVFLIIVLCMIARTIYEASYGLSEKLVTFLVIIQYLFNIGATFTQLTNTGFMKTLNQYTFNDVDIFYDFNQYIVLWQIQLVFLAFGGIFLPFRFYQILCQFKIFSSLKRILNSIYRLKPYLLITFFVMSGLFVLLNQDVKEFKTIFNAIVSLYQVNFYNFAEFKNFIQDPFYKSLYLLVLLIVGTRILIGATFLAGVSYLFSKSFQLEKGGNIITPGQRATLQELAQIRDELDQMVVMKKSVLYNDTSKLDKSFKHKAVVCWTLCSSSTFSSSTNVQMKQSCDEMFKQINKDMKNGIDDDKSERINMSSNNIEESFFIDESQNNHGSQGNLSQNTPSINAKIDQETSKILKINHLIFQDQHQTISFLKSYFLIKPQLLTSETLYRFRIVLQNLIIHKNDCRASSKGTSNSKNTQEDSQCEKMGCGNGHLTIKQQQRQITQILGYLKETYCKVPVMLYYNNENDAKFMKFLSLSLRKYEMFFWSDNIGEVQRFCKMENLFQFKRNIIL